ncbi:fam-a protein [Plasmodium chabaudi adami]|uniref:Fam-a protein n=1 Tax=Plasmodium chabaudi adami TaxID=5826 RepID=A0A1D3L9Y7_PLACE|nr:fam-a protein [Plasmodium chabaudi adami]
MNKGYIKVVLALLSVAGYMENVAFASDRAPSTNSSNEETKQQLSLNTEEDKEQLSIGSEEDKQQLSTGSEEDKQQLSTGSEEDKQQLFINFEEIKKKVSFRAKKPKRKVSFRTKEFKHQVSFAPKKTKHQVSSTPKKGKYQPRFDPRGCRHHRGFEPKRCGQQAHFGPRECMHDLFFGPRGFIHQLTSKTKKGKQQPPFKPKKAKKQAPSKPKEAKKQAPSKPKEAKQQVSSEPKEVKQQVSIGSEEVNPQLATGSEEVKQQISSKPKKAKKQISIDPEEAKEAADVMAEALALAQKHAKHTKNYKLYYMKDEEAILHFKTVNYIDIGKLVFTIPNPDSYDGIVNMLWDPNGIKNYDNLFDKGKFYRTYNENLVILQQRYRNPNKRRVTYCHALASKFQLSEDETAIVFASSDINGPDDDGDDYGKYENPIVESANTFNPKFNSEQYIENEKLSQMYINLKAFFIKKENDYVKITHISSIDHDASIYATPDLLKWLTSQKMINAIKLRGIFKKE